MLSTDVNTCILAPTIMPPGAHAIMLSLHIKRLIMHASFLL